MENNKQTLHHALGVGLRAALPPVSAFEIGAEKERPPSRSLKESIQRMSNEADLLGEEIMGHPFHLTLHDLAERLR